MVSKKKKTKRAETIIQGIMAPLKSDKIYKTINYKHKNEAEIKLFMHSVLLDGLKKIYRRMQPNLRESTIQKKADRSLFWESDVKTTINNIIFLGVQHRPDFLVDIYGLRIGVEIKRGDDGSSIREGLGQSLVYSTEYDFVVYLFIDISSDKKIGRSYNGQEEKQMVKSLWENYNIWFDVV